jgi:uncharacterized protein YecT (DUF1311 family)
MTMTLPDDGVTMTEYRLMVLLLTLIGICMSTPLRAEPCDFSGMSTIEKGECAAREAADAEAQMRKSYGRAIAANKALLATGWKADFQPDIRETQRLWSAWMKRQCEFEGDVTMGSAAVHVVPCRKRMAQERAKALDEIAQQLQP